MHKLAPFLRVQLDQDSNAQFMGRLNQLMYQQIEKNYANSIFIFKNRNKWWIRIKNDLSKKTLTNRKTCIYSFIKLFRN